jgi:hypothetical protein
MSKKATQPKCPQCGQTIDHLHVRVTEEYSKSYAGDNGTFDDVDQISTTFDSWSCPECGYDFGLHDQDMADAFLSGKRLPERFIPNTQENRETLAHNVAEDAGDMDDLLSIAINGCLSLYERDSAKFLEDWKATFDEKTPAELPE